MKNQFFLFLLISILFFRCSNSTNPNTDQKEYGIYLLKDTLAITSDAKKLPLNFLDVQETPIISIDDIEIYDWSKQIISLTSEAFEKFGEVQGKIKSVYGLPFVVMVNGQKIYLGNIYPLYSSYIHEDLPFVAVSPFTKMQISRAPDINIVDVRLDKRIYSILKSKNKIKE